METHFYRLKDEVRILGLDDAPFSRQDTDALVVGTVFRGGRCLDGVVSTRVSVDGLDATEKLKKLIEGLRFRDIRVVMIDGIAFAGFNVIDLESLSQSTGLAVISVTRQAPDFQRIRSALENTFDSKKRYSLMMRAGKPKKTSLSMGGHVYIQHSGVSETDAKALVRMSATKSKIPEPIRAAHMIGQGIVLGQSRGRA